MKEGNGRKFFQQGSDPGDILNFGMYEGWRFGDVYICHPTYGEWAILAQGTARAVWCSLVTCLIFPWTRLLLCTCSSVVQEHFQGLAQAGRYLRWAGLISPKDARKLRMIDDCCALVRHITTVSSAQTVNDLKDKISCAKPAPERHDSRCDLVPAATNAAQLVDHAPVCNHILQEQIAAGVTTENIAEIPVVQEHVTVHEIPEASQVVDSLPPVQEFTEPVYNQISRALCTRHTHL